MTSVSPSAAQVEEALREKQNPEKQAFFPKFFKTGPAEYGEGDQFLGVTVPDQRQIARRYRDLSLDQIQVLLDREFHECRLTGVLILVAQFERAKSDGVRKSIYDFYLRNIDRVNNWDLVDSPAHKIVGPYLENRSRRPLYQLARANHLWKNRVAIIATLHFIRSGDLQDTVEIAKLLVEHPHDLIHKAVGWMLREAGQKDLDVLLDFINAFGARVPRTMLRYAIEKLPERKRKAILEATSRKSESRS